MNLTHRGFAPSTLTEAMQFSEHLASSSMVPRQYQGKPADILVAVQWGYEIGLAPMQALQNISVINGKPSVYGDAAMALVQASPVCEGVEEFFEGEGTPNPVAVCVASRKGRKPVRATFSVEDARRAGLWGKQGPWQAYPKRMLQMRARGFALRDAFPDVLKGLITIEEAQDYPDEAAGKTPPAAPISRNPLDAIAPPALPPAEKQQTTAELQATFEAAGIEVVQVEEVTEEELEREAIIAESGLPDDAPGYALMVPGQDKPLASYPTITEWAAAYEAIADKTAKAGRAPPRTRMTKLRELRDVNADTLQRVPIVAKTQMLGDYNKRLSALGAMLTPEERAAESSQV